MASIREQLRQLEDVSEGMFDENARYVFASQTTMPIGIYTGTLAYEHVLTNKIGSSTFSPKLSRRIRPNMGHPRPTYPSSKVVETTLLWEPNLDVSFQ